MCTKYFCKEYEYFAYFRGMLKMAILRLFSWNVENGAKPTDWGIPCHAVHVNIRLSWS